MSSYNQALRPEQRNYLKVLLLTYEVKPIKMINHDEISSVRSFCILLTQHRFFEVLILLSILINTIVLACHHYMISDEKETTLNRINQVFVIIFTIEAVLKITA